MCRRKAGSRRKAPQVPDLAKDGYFSQFISVVGEGEPSSFWKNSRLLVADRLGSDTPLVGDLGGCFAHQGILNQGGLECGLKECAIAS